MPKRITKLIGGKKHHQLICAWCNLPVWTQSNPICSYVCNTCYDVRFKGGSLCQTPGVRVPSSEWRYNRGT